MRFVRKIDENGMFIEDAFVDELTALTVETPCPAGFYRPKWDGKAWVEGMALSEIDAIKANVEPDPDSELVTAISNATTIAQLKDALLGKYGISKVKAERKS